MKLSIVLALALAACGSPKTKNGSDSVMVNEGSAAKPESCCCKSFPLTSEDGKPAYETGINRMECSGRQGECVDEVQCTPQKPIENPSTR